ncbi:MAG: beta-eliminating lyase-related protein [Peptostreptococcus sp.]|uniref:threonine aldolase family protein n=1 Tax=Peptostreptococcus sp. TaxID=1262 RepID=UPI002FC81D7C
MFRFENDYAEGCIKEILDELVRTNYEQSPGYRADKYCESAAAKIQEACKKDVDVHFLVGGTQANMIVLDAVLRPHQGVVSPILGHVNVHEVGAIEGRGHKVITISNDDEKLDSESKISSLALDKYLSDFFNKGDWHKAQPGAVYISHPTERGALYTREELINIKNVCEKFDLPLFLDGARLAYALSSDENDISLKDLANYTDMFYIGGTKCGAMFGEAVCFTNDKYNRDFNCISKHNGGVLAKGRMLGIQFDTLFTDNNYTNKCKNAYKYAMRIKKAFEDKNVEFLVESYTNQQFPILTIDQQNKLKEKNISFNIESDIDEDKNAVRFCSSWATTEEAVKALEAAIGGM